MVTNFPGGIRNPKRVLADALYKTSRSYVRARKNAHVEFSRLASAAASIPYPDNVVVGVKSAFIGLLIPKSANTYLAKWLHAMELEAASLLPYQLSHDDLWQRSHLASTQQLMDLPGGLLAAIESPPYTVVVVIRDPVERLLSCYLDKRRNHALSGIRRELPKSSWSNFEKWVVAVTRGDRLFANEHWAPQAWQIGSLLGYIDELVPLPHVTARLSHLGRERGWSSEPELDPKIHLTGAKDAVSRYVSPAARQLILDHYADDVRLFAEAAKSGARLPQPHRRDEHES